MVDCVPQVSIISPTLFLIFISDISRTIEKFEGIHTALYADHLCIWTSKRKKTNSEWPFNHALKRSMITLARGASNLKFLNVITQFSQPRDKGQTMRNYMAWIYIRTIKKYP